MRRQASGTPSCTITHCSAKQRSQTRTAPLSGCVKALQNGVILQQGLVTSTAHFDVPCISHQTPSEKFQHRDFAAILSLDDFA